MPIKSVWQESIYVSATNLSTNSNSGVLAMPDLSGGRFPSWFQILGNNILTDETLAITLDFYTDAAGAVGSLGTITFNTLTASALSDAEVWPGDIAGTMILVPCPPYFRASWVVAGTTPSMGFTLYGSYWNLLR